MKYFWILIALLALSFAVSAQSDRVKTVETRDSASLVIFDTVGTEYNGVNVQEALEELDFDAGNIFFISTNGNDATGRRGYKNKPFSPNAPLDSIVNNATHWYYPGEYVVTNTGGDYPPKYINAPNTKITGPNTSGFLFDDIITTPSHKALYTYYGEFIGGSSMRYCRFKTDANDMYLDFNAKKLEVNALGHFFVLKQGVVNVNSILINSGGLLYQQPTIDNRSTIFNVGQLTIDNSSGGAARTTFAIANDGADSCHFEANVKDLTQIDGSLIYTNDWIQRDGRYSTDILRIGKARIIRTTANTADTTLSVINYTSVQNINGAVFLRYSESQDIYSYHLTEFDHLESQKLIDIVNVSNNSTHIINIKKGRFTQSRAIQFRNNWVSENVNFFINFEDVTSDVNAVVINYTTDVTSKINISGKLTTNAAGKPVIFSSGSNLYLDNVELYGDGTTPCITAGTPITVYINGDLYMNSDSIDPNITFVRVDYGYQNPINNQFESTQTILDSVFAAIPKQSATLYQETLRQYAFTSGDTILIDTLTNALITDSITQDTGYIRNISSDTVRWQVSYNFFRDSDEDPLTTFIDLTTDGSDDPEAIEGSRAYSEQAVAQGVQHVGQTFTVDVPPGDAIRLCTYGSGVAAGVTVSDITISVTEIYRE